jgi:hypothetical protein
VTSASPRELQALHASKSNRDTLLTTSAADPATADHQPPLGMRRSTKTLAPQRRPRLHASPRGEERRRAVRSRSDGGVRFGRARPEQAGGSGPAWLASAGPARSLFFQ